MMLYPAMGELSAQIHNRYMLVNVVARRARYIAEAYENAHQILNEKPVTIAISEVANGLLQDPEQTPPPDETAETEETAEDAEVPEVSEDAEAAEPEPQAEAAMAAEAHITTETA